MIVVGFIIITSYVILIGSFAFGFDKVPTHKPELNLPKTRFSVIIPFRNEAEQLPRLLKSINLLKYPTHLFEIIFVDDASEDRSVEIIKQFIEDTRLQICITTNNRTSNSPKKDAITTAIDLANNRWIVTTDADCMLPELWLGTYDLHIQKTKSQCVVAPVTYFAQNNFLNTFQLLDILSLQGATIGGFGINKPFLCNGANLAYRKDFFHSLNGFEGNTDTASGDDIFLLEKALKHNLKAISYLKSEHAIVKTNSQPSWLLLASQRIRWAAKTSMYNNWFGKLTGLIVLLTNTFIIVALLAWGIDKLNTDTLLYIFIIKFSIDYLLIYKAAGFFKQKDVMRLYPFGFVVYPFFSVSMALASQFLGYKWKGRTFKK